jgi:Sulfotransferase domain
MDAGEDDGEPTGMSSARIADLVIAGVPKAATGSLFGYLAQHSDICASDLKETGYFNHYNPQRHTGPVPPIETYARHFAHWNGERYALEATPTYSYGGRPVVEAIRSVLGKPKIIISLRDPADRLWSAYGFQRSVGNNARISSFEQYVEILEQRYRDGVQPVPRDGLHGLRIGFYADYLGDWFDEFGDDLRVVFLENLRNDPRGEVATLCTWLDIDPGMAAALDVGRRKVTEHPRSTRLAAAARTVKRRTTRILPSEVQRRLQRAYLKLNSGGELTEQFDPALRRHVEDLYRESNQATARMLTARGYRDLPEWLATSSAA